MEHLLLRTMSVPPVAAAGMAAAAAAGITVLLPVGVQAVAVPVSPVVQRPPGTGKQPPVPATAITPVTWPRVALLKMTANTGSSSLFVHEQNSY